MPIKSLDYYDTEHCYDFFCFEDVLDFILDTTEGWEELL